MVCPGDRRASADRRTAQPPWCQRCRGECWVAEVRSPEPDVPETGSWRRPDLYEAGEVAGPGLVEVTFDELRTAPSISALKRTYAQRANSPGGSNAVSGVKPSPDRKPGIHSPGAPPTWMEARAKASAAVAPVPSPLRRSARKAGWKRWAGMGARVEGEARLESRRLSSR